MMLVMNYLKSFIAVFLIACTSNCNCDEIKKEPILDKEYSIFAPRLNKNILIEIYEGDIEKRWDGNVDELPSSLSNIVTAAKKLLSQFGYKPDNLSMVGISLVRLYKGAWIWEVTLVDSDEIASVQHRMIVPVHPSGTIPPAKLVPVE